MFQKIVDAFKQRMLVRRLSKALLKAHGGQCRYSFGGGNMAFQFTAPIAMDEQQLAIILREAADALEAPKKPWSDY